MDLELRDKRALVTSGSRGIGKAIARALAHEGMDVALLARNRLQLEATAEELARESRRKVVPVVADTTDDAQVGRAFAEAVQALGGGIDVLVNAAAEPGEGARRRGRRRRATHGRGQFHQASRRRGRGRQRRRLPWPRRSRSRSTARRSRPAGARRAASTTEREALSAAS